MIQTYNELISSFALHVGLDADTLAATQEIVIEGLSVGLLYDGDETMGDIVYFTQLGTPQAHQVASVYKTMLEANNLWVGTGGCTLGIQAETGAVVLCGRLGVEGVTAEGLGLLMDAFTDTALFWQKLVTDTLPSEQAGLSPAQFMMRG